jgi:hypothetical protein
MEDAEYDYENEDEDKGLAQSNTSFSNMENAGPNSPFNDFNTFQNNGQS